MDHVRFGRKIYSLAHGDVVLESTSVTERALPNEDERTFTRRLVGKYPDQHGTIEVVFKRGLPDYAIITFS
jgi:hypothetical protein